MSSSKNLIVNCQCHSNPKMSSPTKKQALPRGSSRKTLTIQNQPKQYIVEIKVSRTWSSLITTSELIIVRMSIQTFPLLLGKT